MSRFTDFFLDRNDLVHQRDDLIRQRDDLLNARPEDPIPAVLFNTLPKSASVFILETLGKPVVPVSPSDGSLSIGTMHNTQKPTILITGSGPHLGLLAHLSGQANASSR
jgi:hypothetical protein